MEEMIMAEPHYGTRYAFGTFLRTVQLNQRYDVWEAGDQVDVRFGPEPDCHIRMMRPEISTARLQNFGALMPFERAAVLAVIYDAS
jgi:hypothetical protein